MREIIKVILQYKNRHDSIKSIENYSHDKGEDMPEAVAKGIREVGA